MCLPLEVQHPEMVLKSGTHEGFPWRIMNNGMGYRCGYIRVPKSHPWYGANYDDINADVHGGLNYSESDEHNGWWLGFDCSHYGDAPDPDLPFKHVKHEECKHIVMLGLALRMRGAMATIKTTDYVKKECWSLCEQAKAALEKEN